MRVSDENLTVGGWQRRAGDYARDDPNVDVPALVRRMKELDIFPADVDDQPFDPAVK